MPITVTLDPPNRQDKPNFAPKSDKLMADLVLWTVQANALAEEISAREASASSAAGTATSQASEATAARDIAMAAVNYKGVWSSLAGALSIPASAYHSGSIWMLTQSVANVALETPGVSSKWINVTPASGLGSAAYQPSSAFQPAIGVLTGILMSAGGGNISAATAAQLVAAIGSTYVANASHATSADSANIATSVMDGAINSASKLSNGILTWVKHAAMSTGRLIGRSSSGAGSPEEISIGQNLTLVNNELSATGVQLSDFTGAHQSLSPGGKQEFPGGFIIKFGSGNASAPGVVNSFSEAFPNQCLGVFPVGTPTGSYYAIQITARSKGDFTAYSPSGSQAINYIAIGS